jgi:hypothetical protein
MTVAGPEGARRIEVLAVTTDDAVAALEAALRSDSDVVLRATPPFRARMRARLHRRAGASEGSLVVDPRALFEGAPSYPEADETADDLAHGEAFTDRHRDRHREAVAEWRAAVRAARADVLAVETPAGEREVQVAWLG